MERTGWTVAVETPRSLPEQQRGHGATFPDGEGREDRGRESLAGLGWDLDEHGAWPEAGSAAPGRQVGLCPGDD